MSAELGGPVAVGSGLQAALATWALQFTPRVALLEDAVVLEVYACLRLFGGAKALRRLVARDARQLGCQRMAWAPTSLAALALARAMQPDGFREPLAALLDRLPLTTLSAAASRISPSCRGWAARASPTYVRFLGPA